VIKLATEIFERHNGRELDDFCRRRKLMLGTRGRHLIDILVDTSDALGIAEREPLGYGGMWARRTAFEVDDLRLA
jgi:hypothetical protein